MIPGLYDDERSTLKRLSLVFFGAAIALMPFLPENSFEARAAGLPSTKTWSAIELPSPATFGSVHVERDPFVSDASTVLAPNDDGVQLYAAGIVLPPNAGADGVPSDGVSAQTFVRAVVLGKQSRALVDVNGSVNVLGVGDVIAGSTIVGIDALGIVLANGTRVALAESTK